jgi:2-polyprenyl-3-methyl-5-hydroxy-6-metoxy-1,4-benzoquinol methylase
VKAADRALQRRRIAQAVPWIPAGSHVLDVGCADGALFRQRRSPIRSGVGIDLVEPNTWPDGDFERRTGSFPDVVRDDETFDAVVMLAVIEHVSESALAAWAGACARLLRPGGRLILTVPSPAVDTLLHVGMRLRLLDGIEAHQHHGFQPSQLPGIFGPAGLTLERLHRFQFGLNNLFVFSRVTP